MLSIELIRRLIAFVNRMLRRYHTRRQLLELEDRLLRDIGISRKEACIEANKPFWKA